MRDAVIAVGIAMMLGAGIVVLWSSLELRNLERAHDFVDDWDEWYPFNGLEDLVDDQYEKQHDYYTSVRIVGVVGLISGAIITLYGFLAMKEVPRLSSAYPPTMQTTPGTTSYCEYCGRRIGPGAVWCPGCGRKFKQKGNEGNREQGVR